MLNNNEIYRLSAVTFFVKNMETSCKFYDEIPSLKRRFGGPRSPFTTYKIGSGDFFLNLEESKQKVPQIQSRVIFHVSDVDSFYESLRKNPIVQKSGYLEDKPKDASWGERFFHLRDPDNYQLSFARPLETC